MNSLIRIASFAAAVAVVAGGAGAIGSATRASPPVGAAASTMTGVARGMSGMDHGRSVGMPGMAPMVAGADGTHLSLDGLTLAPMSVDLAAGRSPTWRFRILDREGMPVRAFERDQTKLLHLIVVRSDLTDYQHLHPALAPDGTFAVRLKLSQAGRYRAIADFTTAHKRYVLGTTLLVPGPATEVPLPAPASTAATDGYQVSLKRHARLAVGSEAQLTFAITRGGRPVTGLQPYLGAYGHLVALHAPDLSYSHVHPTGEQLRNGAITFHTELPKPGAYRLFLQFRTGGRVHTAAFTQTTTT